MNSLKSVKVITLVFLLAQFAVGATYHVAKDGSAGYTTIGDAIKAAKAGKNPSNEIIIDDNGTYKEQVTIDTLDNFTLKSANPSSKPTILFQDTVNTHPHTLAEAQSSNLKNSFDENGALRVLYSHNVVISGIIIDGGGVAPFGSKDVWFNAKQNSYSALVGGNSALHITVSGDVKALNCEFRNAYYGVNFKDRNIGGIYANVNPSDVDSLKIVPNSGFGHTGNHLIEQCRIHDDAWGMFFESSWDLGSTIRYNLFYENHMDASVRTKLKSLTSESDANNEPGGGMFFKDDVLSPLAIYNNTFWHNYMIICGHWKAGDQHLIFNNIYASPFQYWDKVAVSSYMAMDPNYTNRMHNCVYSVQQQALGTPQKCYLQTQDPGLNTQVFSDTVLSYNGVQIINQAGTVETISLPKTITLSDGTVYKGTLSNLTVEGNRIIAAGTTAKVGFPASAEIRWLEPHFKSTDPKSGDFLVPDWDDSLVNQFIVDKGWSEADVRDADGSAADLGAIPKGGVPKTITTIKPTFPLVFEANGSGTAMFDVENFEGGMTNPTITYFTLINNIANATDLANDKLWANGITPIPTSYIIKIKPAAVSIGSNTITFNLPSGVTLGQYAFIEMTIEGTDQSGNKVTSTVGFLPYRKLDYKFVVEVWDVAGKNKLTEVKAGDPVTLHITPFKVGSTKPFANDVTPIELTLSSHYKLHVASDDSEFKLDTVKGGSTEPTTVTVPVVFTKVPQSGSELVSVYGIYGGTSTTEGASFGGVSDPIKIIPGDPAKVLFQDPPSKGVGKVSPGSIYNVRVDVFDKYDNKVTAKADVSLSSAEPKIGDVQAPNQVASDTGTAWFKVFVGDDGKFNDTFHLTATLVGKGATDDAKMVIDKDRNKFWVFYDDTSKYNDTLSLRGQAGDILPIVIRVSPKVDSIIDTTVNFIITPGSPNLKFYASKTDTTPATTFKITNGKVKIWVKGTGVVQNGNVSITGVEPGIRSGYRENIYFTTSAYPVEYANYYSSNGFGKVDSVDIFYKKEITDAMIPDSVELLWPDVTNRKMIKGKMQWVLSADKKHISIKLPDPFPEAITTFGASQSLVTTYWNDPAAPDIPMQKPTIKANDKVGPLLMSGLLTERPSYNGTGYDTIKITLSEAVKMDPTNTLKGQSLTLRKLGGGSFQLNILQADQIGDTITLVVENAGINSPKAGDSLQITSTGPTVDLYDNHANIDNRPVVLLLKAIPAQIDTACYYYDEDGNGLIDKAVIKFLKNVNKDELSMAIIWKNAQIEYNKDNLAYGDDSSIIIVKLKNNPNDTVPKTNGTMKVQATFLSFAGQPKSNQQDVKDKAAPVIFSANYDFGDANGDGTVDKDKLSLVFSEPVGDFVTNKEPYVFYNGSTQYSMILTPISHNNENEYVYSVDTVTIVSYPKNGDLVQIQWQPSSISDKLSNFQNITTNRKVSLKVNTPKYDLIVKSGPNPFNPNNQKFTIYIDPVVRALNLIRVEVNIKIQDQLGNIVYNATKELNENDKETVGGKRMIKYGEWNGLNLNGRVVGSGTYVAVIKVRNLNPGAVPPTPKPVLIGVRR